MQQHIEETHPDMSAILPAEPEETCFLTTYGRNGGAHEVEMRYAQLGNTLYMLSTEGGDAEWVRNLLHNPEASLRIGTEKRAGMGRVVTNAAEDGQVRRMLARKYEGWRERRKLSDWALSALPVAIDMTATAR
ncbi:MAG TPA: nitroreductase/quinone reductase family protein [Ktedonobacterales bacterium]|nr:nitroreductase/quinone reductase family protein [Ktedonobacterales bacterium]